jgi:hypothetical protein
MILVKIRREDANLFISFAGMKRKLTTSGNSLGRGILLAPIKKNLSSQKEGLGEDANIFIVTNLQGFENYRIQINEYADQCVIQ